MPIKINVKPLYRRGGDHFDTGQPRIEIERLMDAETFMGAAQAVENRFAGAVGDGVDGNIQARADVFARSPLPGALSTRAPATMRMAIRISSIR